MPEKPLTGIRVLDFSWFRAGPWGTRWLATLGAEVIKVEWPHPGMAGNTGRTPTGVGGTTPPGVTPGPNSQGTFNDSHAGKLGITLNLRSEKGLGIAKRLLAQSDFVAESFSAGVLESWGLGYEEMNKIRPGIIYLSMSGFGHTGPKKHYTTVGPVAQALSGLTHTSGLPDREPAGWGWSYLDDTGGMSVAIGALAALHHRNQTGQGQHVDMSQVEVGMSLNGAAILDASVNGRSSRRDGFPPGNRAVWPGAPWLDGYRGPIAAPHNSYRTAPGGYNDWCAITCLSDEEWACLRTAMDNPGWAVDARFATTMGRLTHQEELDEKIESWTSTIDKYAVMERCQNNGVRCMPVQSTQDRVDNDLQLRSQALYVPVTHPVLGTFPMQNAPFIFSETPVRPSRAPLLGEHNIPVLEGLASLSRDDIRAGYEDGTLWPAGIPMQEYLLTALETAPPVVREVNQNSPDLAPATGSRGMGPLTGLRVIEVTNEVGQFCGKLLADLGADVIKVEPPGGAPERHIGPFYHDEAHPDRSLHFWHYNTGKKGITLDLDTDQGRELFLKLIGNADILLESMPPGYFTARNMGYEQLKPNNPALIMCSLTPFGQTGPWSQYKTSDMLHLAAGGQMACCGYDNEDSPPIAGGGGNAWHMGGNYAVIGILGALAYRDRMGKGQFIDASIHGACALTTEHMVSVYIYEKLVVHRQTGRHASASNSLRTQFRCKDGRYVNAPMIGPRTLKPLIEWMDTIAVQHDLTDPKYQDPGEFRTNQAHIVEILDDFFSRLTSDEAYTGGQERSFSWGVIRSPDETLADEHFHERGYFTSVHHPELGESFTYPGAFGKFHGSPTHVSRRAPLIAEHNREVYEKLGLNREALVVLRESGVI